MGLQRTAWVCGVVAIVSGGMYVCVAALLGVSTRVPGGWYCVAAVELLLVVQVIMLITVCVVWGTLLQALKADYIHISTISGWENFPRRTPGPDFDNDQMNDDGNTDDYYAGWYSDANNNNEGPYPYRRRLLQGITQGFPEIGAVGSGMVLFMMGLVICTCTLIAGVVAATRGIITEPECMYSGRANVYKQNRAPGVMLTQVTEGIYEQ